MYYTINDASYWYETYGEGTPLVMLHGFTGTSNTWNEFIKDKADVFKVITVDLPGHGRTKINTPRTMKECCRDLHGLFNKLELEPFCLLGYSMGGRTALSYLMYYPERVEALILESASPGIADDAARKIRKAKDEQLAEEIKNKGIRSFVDYWESIPLFQSQLQLSEAKRREIRNERLSQSTAGLADSLNYMGTGSQEQWWRHLSKITMPVLLIAGALDEKFVDTNKKMQQMIPEAQLEICSEAGHAIHVEKPETFGKLVTEFVLAQSDII